MALGSGDILLYESSDSGSTGGIISTTTISSGVSNNVWPDVSSSERIAGGTRYRKVFWRNNSDADAAVEPVLYAAVLPTNITLSIGLGTSHANDDDETQGNMTAFGANALAALVSDGADTRTVTLYGRDASDDPISESVTLNGTTEVLSTNTYSVVYGAFINVIDSARTVTVAQGSGGTVRGTIAEDKVACWLWVSSPSAKASGIVTPNLPAGNYIGVWMRQTWNAGVASVRPNSMTLSIEENN